MPDARSRRVVFLAHCLLNQNTRYPGGAACPGVVAAAVDRLIADGTGIVQLPCPEQRVWGGVLKSRMLWLFDHPWVARAGPALARLMVPYLRWRYSRLARPVAADIADYLTHGFVVSGVVGVAGSPSCGVRTTLDLPAALGRIAHCPHAAASADRLNADVIAPALRPGTGLFIQSLREELDRRQLVVPVDEYQLTPRTT